MTRTRKSFAMGLFALLALCVLATALTACGSKKYELVVDGSSETGDILITANGCKADGMSTTACTVEEGMQVTVQSSLTEGTLHLTFGPSLGGEDADVKAEVELVEEGLEEDGYLEYEVTGTSVETIDLEPGEYSLTVTGDDDAPATGSVSITMRGKN